MDNILNYLTELLILLFIVITFLQSGLDKALDWKGNVEWLKGHFGDTFLSGTVPLLVAVIMVFEIVTGLLAIAGIYGIVVNENTGLGLASAVLAGITLLMLLFGQRIAKDYAGAFTLTGYFIVVIFGVFLLTA